MATSAFLSKFNDIFDVFNSMGDITKSKYGVPIKRNSVHIDFLKHMKDWIAKLKYVTYNRDGSKKVLAATNLPSFRGWIQSINALLLLVDDVIADEIPSLCTNRLNQDCVENIFS